MSKSKSEINPSVIAANQKVHSQIASKYNETEPHFRPENQEKVRRRLEQLANQSPSRHRLLDLGCGTGFLLNLSHDLFEKVNGIDLTQAMLDRVDLSPGNIEVTQGIVEDLPFENETFDAVTAYSFIDHLADHRAVFREAHRVLKPGGRLYVDLIPNRDFWNAVESVSSDEATVLDPIVRREVDELVNHEEKLLKNFGIDPSDWRLTEPAKSEGHGFDAQVLKGEIEEIGFECDIEFEWFLGQAKVMHEISMDSATLIDNHLHKLLPITSPLFKYLVLTGVKK